MKKPTFSKATLLATSFLMCFLSFAQNYVPFNPRFNQDLKGDIILIGNNILGPGNAPFNNNTVYNHTVDMRYIDIDGDPTTFSSSSADLAIPNPNCYQIIYAGLYWGAVTNGPEPITEVKFKGPTGGYHDIQGTIIYDANGVITGDSYPYSCFADVTSIVTSMGNDQGTYTVANVSSAQGATGTFNPYNGTGYSAGWSLFIVYEDPTLPGKSITSFDGFSAISSSVNLDVPVSGFRTVPAPAPVRATFAFAALEGDKPILNDRMVLNGVPLSTADRSANNFFNSSVTQLDATPVMNRNPNSTNTLGFDTGVMVVPNPGNTVIANDATSAVVRLESNQDVYFQYFFAFAVEIIEPHIVLTKIVEDDMGNNIGGQNVVFGQQLNYVIGFQNTGNDHATSLIIRDILPININFDYPSGLTLPPGVTVVSYNPITREIIFSVDDSYVEEGDPVSEIRIAVTVVEDCIQLSDACSNIINNQAFATYNGFFNPNFTVSDDPSINSNTGCLLTPQATNFLVDMDQCQFDQTHVLCGDSLVLTAAGGYSSYSWSTSPTGTPVIGTGQSITVTATGTYYVHNVAPVPCQSIDQAFHVVLYGGGMTNPVIPYADEVVICPNNGKPLPNIYLCGANDSRFIQTGINDAVSIIWEQLDEGSCAPVSNPDCANESSSCTWNQVGSGPDFLANTAGQFRLTINYEGGCFNQFYFNVYQNLLNPTAVATDIICDTPGSITVGGVPSGYEYSLDGVNYQTSNIFTVTTPGFYTIYIRQVGVSTNPCIFTVPDVQVRDRNFTGTVNVNQPLCHGDQGSIQLVANDAPPQYTFSLHQGATLINSVGPITVNHYTFNNLNPGTYTATIETEDGCLHTEDVQIINPPLLTVTAAITVPLSCEEGEITVYPVGGTPPYFYFVNSTTDFQTVPEIVVTSPGTYNILVMDSNNCSATTTIEVDAVLPPEFDIVTTDIACADSSNAGIITINVSNNNGNTLAFSIDGGITFTNSNVFTGLSVGNYEVVVQYTYGSAVCDSVSQSVTIQSATTIEGDVDLTSPLTCNGLGVITITNVTGGTPPYTYSIDGTTFQAGTTFNGLNNGTYTITVMDSSGCATAIGQITIASLDPPTDMTFANTSLSCPDNTTDVTISGVTGGIGNLQYQIIAPTASATSYQSSNVFENLSPGTYTFQVMDENGCTYSESYSIAPLDPITVVGQNINEVSCFGGADGVIEFVVTGTSNFTYSINGGAPVSGTSTITLNGMAAGTYTIIVTDNITNCEATATVEVQGPGSALDMTLEVTPITCLNNGGVAATVSGGWGGNTYTLTLPNATVLGPQASNTFGNLTLAGTYTITTEDANGCIVSESFDLNVPDAVVASISTTSDFCYDNNGASIEVSVTSGQAPFEYSINGGAFQSSNIFTGLVPGTYTITVRDAYGCTVALNAQTIEPQLVLGTILTQDLDCTATPDAVITGTITGGYAPYTYFVSFNGGAYSSLGTATSPFTYSTSNDGVYQFQVVDAQGCTVESGTVTVNPLSLPALSLVAQTQPILCHGDSNGAIQLTIDTTVGTPPFSINVHNDTTGTNYGNQTSGLPAGTYTVTLTDSKSCSAVETVTISEPDQIVVDYHTIDITCTTSGISQGSIIIDGVTGGVAPYNYFVTGTNGYSNSEFNATGTTSVSFDVVDFGLYQINIIDANGCSVLIQDVLVASPPTDLDIDVVTSVDCTTGGVAVVSIGSTLSSSGPFFFSIYQGPISNYPNPPGSWLPEDSPGSQSATFTNLTPGVLYTFIVYDVSTNCSYYEPATTPIPTNSTLTASAVTANNITCTGSADGNVSFTVTSVYGTAVNVDYEIFDSLSLISTGVTGTGTVPANGTLSVVNLGPLPFGNYYILINETTGSNSGCGIVTVPFNITESAIPLSLSFSIDQNANCNANSGVISAIGQNGTPPYQYQITTVPGAPSTTDPSWASSSTFNLDAGVYYVHVMDAYGCIVSSTANILPMDPSPVVAVTFDNQCTSAEGQFEIDVMLTTVGVAPYMFSIDGGAFQTQTPPFTITNLSSGIHTVEVRDVNGCGNLVSVTIETPIGLNASVTTLASCSDDDGVITVNGFGGTGTYTYSIAPSAPSISLSGNVFTGVPSDTYTITVTDTNTSCSTDTQVTLEAATPVTFTVTATDVYCNGGNDGTITVDLPISNDNPIYIYEIIAPIIVPAQTTNVFSGLSAGTYTVQVTSGRGCVATQDVVVGQPDLLTVAATATDFACTMDNSVTTSLLTIAGAGGTIPYLYSIDGINYFVNNEFNIVDNGTVQTISFFIKDANGCVVTDSINILPLPVMTLATVSLVTAIDCNNTGSVEILVTGGSGSYSYQLLPDGTPQASNVFAVTAPGTYNYQVIDNGTGCGIVTAPFVVAPYDLMDVAAVPVSSVSCFGNTDGTIELTVNGYSGNYTYQIFNSLGNPVTGAIAANTSVNPQTVSGLAGGNYTVEVIETDSPYCSSTTNTFTIVSPPVALSLVASETSNVTCNDGQGTITAFADGGWGPYEYALSGPVTIGYSSSSSFANLSAGTYVVTVRDSAGCTATVNVTLQLPTPISATFVPSTTMLSCFGDQNASITVTNTSGGQGSNYSYTLNTILPTPSTSGPQSSPVFDNLGAGTYSITITDGLDCEFVSMNIVIGEPTPIQANLVMATTLTCLTDATLTLSASGGVGPYTYSDTVTFATVLGSFNTSTTFQVAVGQHVYYVMDANGCIANVSNEIMVEPLLPLALNLSSVNPDINCVGDNTGEITADAVGGLGDYVYTLQDGAGNIVNATQNVPGHFTELVAGTYVVSVVSGDCTAVSSPIVITEPDAQLDATFVINNVSCSGANDGSIEINATGGTGVIKYAISPQLNQFFDSNVFENLAPGNYQVIVQDVLGCYMVFDFTITEPDPVLISIVPNSMVPEVCYGDSDGAFSIEISGGTAPYSVSLDDINGIYTTGTLTQTQFDFTGLGGGDHTVYVRDSQGCMSEWNITFPESVRIDPVVEIVYNCDNNSLGNIVTVTVDDSIDNPADLDFSLNGGPYQQSNVFINVPPGVGHYIDVRHTNGCIVRTDLFDIDDHDPLTLTLVEGGLNEIIAQAEGGSGDYEFTLNGQSQGSNNTFIITESGTHTVTVTDSFGCVAIATMYLDFVDICIPNYFTPNNDGNNDGWAPGCAENYPNLEFDIFDRYGRKVGTYRYGQYWDGRYNGVELPTGDYWYVVRLNSLTNDRDFVGHFTLYR